MSWFLIPFTGSAFGTSEDRSCTFNGPVNLRAGTNKIALLSVAVGLPVSNLLLNSNLDLIIPLYLAVCSYIDNFGSSFYPRMLDSILKHGKLGSQEFCFMDLTMDRRIWHGRNGHTRFDRHKSNICVQTKRKHFLTMVSKQNRLA